MEAVIDSPRSTVHRPQKVYVVDDLFFTSWDQLSDMVRTEVFALHQELKVMEVGSVQYGYHLIQILRRLRKNWRLVDKINEAQAVDIFNDLAFLKTPWYNFPKLTYKLITPDDYLARHTFQQFIYADNEFTTFLATQDNKYLVRLVATLYKQNGDWLFDKEAVEGRAAYLRHRIKDWELKAVMFSYMHVRDKLMSRCKTLFPALSQTSPDGEVVATKVVPTGKMWLQLKHRLAETKAFAGMETAERANMYSALDYLEDIAQHNAKTK